MAQKRENEETELTVPETIPLRTPTIDDPTCASDQKLSSFNGSRSRSDLNFLTQPENNKAVIVGDGEVNDDRTARPSVKKRPREENRCSGIGCRRKVGLIGFRCRCGEVFCYEHRYSDRHSCSYDYKAAGREAIARENPVVRAAKLLKSAKLTMKKKQVQVPHVFIIITLVFPGAYYSQYPVVVSTWPFLEAVRAAWEAVDGGLSALDAVVEGCSACEKLRCDGTVGPGGSPDENGETTIDAMVMDGVTMEVGAVAAMRFVPEGIKAAKLVMEYTKHTMLAGDQASAFAISMGLTGPTNLSSVESIDKWTKWMENSCQPNFRKNVIPMDSCGPYHTPKGPPLKRCLLSDEFDRSLTVGLYSHDTISMAVIDQAGRIAVGTSTNGASFKIPGRVGDGPIAGSSAYTDAEVGACGATGDGDIMMRFLPCYQVMESMRLGMEPKLAAEDAISRIARKFPDFVGAVFAVNKNGIHAGACHGWTFQYSVRNPEMEDVKVFTVQPLKL